jgi:putative oxidoreductase
MIEEQGDIDEKRLVIPALASFYRQVAPLSYVFMRVVFGLIYLPIGIDKIFLGGAGRIAAGNVARLGWKPEIMWAWIVANVEFFGAILMILGLFVRPVAFAFAIELTVITFGITALRGFFWTVNGAEVSSLLLVLAIAFVFAGAGRYSLDHKFGREF